MGLDLLRDRGTPIERQCFHWKELVQEPISKLDADAMTRVRIILMNGIESEANQFGTREFKPTSSGGADEIRTAGQRSRAARRP